MANINAETALQLEHEVGGLVDNIRKAGDEVRAKLGDVNVDAVTTALPRTAEGAFNPAQWDQLEEQVQRAQVDQLKEVRNTLCSILGRGGPTDPGHIMHWEYATNWQIVLCATLGIVLMVGLLSAIIYQWDRATSGGWAQTTGRASEIVREATDAASTALSQETAAAKAVEDLRGKAGREEDLKTAESTLAVAQSTTEEARARITRAQEAADKAVEVAKRHAGPTERTILIMVVLWGALGGSLHLLRSVAAFVGNRQFVRSWILHYFSLPFIGAALAGVVYLLLRVGLVSPTSATADGSAIANLNVVAIYGFAALTGLFAKAASDKLAELFGTLFRTTGPQEKTRSAAPVLRQG